MDEVPYSICLLKRLQEIDLSYNYNSMSAELPSTMSNCTDLITIDLKNNNFIGELIKAR
ncbi:hypothetical protein ACP4OV_009518 [Aristida adscensionis]